MSKVRGNRPIHITAAVVGGMPGDHGRGLRRVLSESLRFLARGTLVKGVFSQRPTSVIVNKTVFSLDAPSETV